MLNNNLDRRASLYSAILAVAGSCLLHQRTIIGRKLFDRGMRPKPRAGVQEHHIRGGARVLAGPLCVAVVPGTLIGGERHDPDVLREVKQNVDGKPPQPTTSNGAGGRDSRFGPRSTPSVSSRWVKKWSARLPTAGFWLPRHSTLLLGSDARVRDTMSAVDARIDRGSRADEFKKSRKQNT